MKINTRQLAGITLCAAGLMLTGQAKAGAFEDAKKELKTAGANPTVKQELASKGAAIQFTTDGGWCVFGIGSAPCNTDSPEEAYDARRQALGKAKAGISKLIKDALAREAARSANTPPAKTVDGETAPAPKVSRIGRLAEGLNQILQGTVVYSFKKVKGPNGSVVHVAAGSSPAILEAMEIKLPGENGAKHKEPAKTATKKKAKSATPE